jgi:voltage-gated potassium channel
MPLSNHEMDIKEARRIHREFQILAIISLLTLGTGTIMFRMLENWEWIDSLYFSTVSLTTVGYGDITPVTTEGKLFAIFYLLIGIGIIAALINNMVKNQVAKRKIKDYENSNK